MNAAELAVRWSAHAESLRIRLSEVQGERDKLQVEAAVLREELRRALGDRVGGPAPDRAMLSLP